MYRLDAIKIFVRVVESGSFSAVAVELGVGQPAVCKQVASLEAHLGATAFCVPRAISLTEAATNLRTSLGRIDNRELS